MTADAWVLLDPGEAPVDPDGVPCTPLDFDAESGGFEVRTEACDGATFGQPLLAELRAGDRVAIGASHLDLWAPEGEAVAELVLGVGPRELWRAEVPIPSAAAVISAEVAAPADAEVGDPVWYAVLNHGRNSYVLTYVERLPAD